MQDQAAPPTPSEIAAAIERRVQAEREAAQANAALRAQREFEETRDTRQEFRRLIDPGILRPNARELALESLITLKTLAENIVAHPGEDKYKKFKPTNSKIKRVLVDPKGTLEYAVAMGFRPEVVDFQPYYIWDDRHKLDLEIGLAIIHETLERELVKQEREDRTKREAKEAEAAAKEKLKRQFIDDRKSTALRGEREREVREARAAAAARRAASQSSDAPSQPSSPAPQSPPSRRTRMSATRIRPMSGTGRTLDGRVVTEADEAEGAVPPPYHPQGDLIELDEDSEGED
ncbi:uncharacterized protein B0H18DRAFT_965787 [Fomitopsis serialis]|uniref:uncharacterized protein n=1 Tax=Fomitopsis serialis TaxID=139415 RepID=UPI002008C042|nr:uncharacterized protein B0H18DRAFT_965787 [Neoantrodia serialis]KAH9938143.1 hypothetical protein B0H18DRAFT_965787 [Neoantrodia serialis]